jgi:hypothetical protein
MFSEEEVLQCPGCSAAIGADPPDEDHTKPSKEKDESKDPIAIDHECVACGQQVTLYWEIFDP